MIKHTFVHEPGALDLFQDTTTLLSFKNKLSKLSASLPEINPVQWGRKSKEENENVIKGKGFELFCELLVSLMGHHPHIGLTKYEPCQIKDNGIDAFAVNLNNEKSAVQCKFRSDANYEFTEGSSNLGSFMTEALFETDCKKKSSVKKAFLITTAKGINYSTASKWRNSVFEINGKTLKTLVNNNIIFWNSCCELINESRGK